MQAVRDWLAGEGPIVDVRAPVEYERGHIPGAHNIPLFSNAERAVVGTCYKREGRDAAVLEGLRIVGPKLSELVTAVRALAPTGPVRIHCWRGGERSASVAWLLRKAGFGQVDVLPGGYRAFRTLVMAEIATPWPLFVLGGHTGMGKTGLLQYMRGLGAQVVDLEALARHHGSAFGALPGIRQPSNEQFSNDLWQQLCVCSTERPIWVEDESRSIGQVRLPDVFYARMQQAPVHVLCGDVGARVERLVQEYGALPTEQLEQAIQRIAKRLGPQHAKTAIEALQAGDLEAVARIVLVYYDKAYDRCLARRKGGVQQVSMGATTAHELARMPLN